MIDVGPDQLIDVMDTKDFRVFQNESGHDLNLIGIRAADNTVG